MRLWRKILFVAYKSVTKRCEIARFLLLCENIRQRTRFFVIVTSVQTGTFKQLVNCQLTSSALRFWRWEMSRSDEKAVKTWNSANTSRAMTHTVRDSNWRCVGLETASSGSDAGTRLVIGELSRTAISRCVIESLAAPRAILKLRTKMSAKCGCV